MHWKKLIAPIIIALIVIIILFVQLAGIISTDMILQAKIPISIGLIALMGAVIFVLIERIKEVRSGDEDDLSKY